MNKLWGCVLLVTAAAAPMSAQEGRWATVDDPVVREMAAKEKRWADGNCAAQPELIEIFAAGFQGTSTDGTRYDARAAATFDPAHADRDCTFGDVKVQFFGDAVAVAYGSESSMRKGADGIEAKRCLIWTDTWLKQDGKWKIVAAQDNVVDCAKNLK